MAGQDVSAFSTFRQFFALSGDVLVLSLAMFAFSLGFQMTGRYLPVYLDVLGATAVAIGLFKSVGDLIGAVYPYPGGWLSDRVGSRRALTGFGLASSLGFAVWFFADPLAEVSVGPTSAGVVLIFLGLFLSQAWKSFGLGATFAVVKQSVAPEHLAAGFAATETFRRTAFLVGPLLAAGLISLYPFREGFQYVLVVAAAFGLLATAVQHRRYDASGDTVGKSFEGWETLRRDLRALPAPLRPLLVGDTLVRFANGMVYAFFALVVTRELAVGATLPLVGALSPEVFFGVLLAVEMLVALLTMAPVSRLAERVGLKPVVTLGFAVYAVFPLLLVTAPANAAALAVLFAFSGLRFAGLPAHKALIVGPAEKNAGGRVTGAYYLVRNVVVIPAGLLGGWLYAGSPTVAFGVATLVGLLGTGYFLVRGEEFEPYA